LKILIIGERFSTNLGDGVICETVEGLLSKHYKDADITVADISTRQEYRKNKIVNLKDKSVTIKKVTKQVFIKLGLDIDYYKFKKSSLRRNEYIESICNNNYDLAVFAGGQMFKDTFVFPISQFVNHLAKNQTPIIFNACGVGDNKNRKLKKLLKQSLTNENVRFISTRDDIDTLNNFYLEDNTTKAVATFDPAIWVKEVYKIKKKNNDTVGLGVMYVNNMKKDDLIQFWKQIVQQLDKKGIKWSFFCNGDERDYQLMLDILNTFGISEKEKKERLTKRSTTPEELIELISSFKSIISFRLHSHIIAYSLDIPAVALVWDEKLRFFYRGIGLENRCKTINDHYLDIIEELSDAHKIGYDNNLREVQKKYAFDLLVKMVDKSLV
jgi:polysaccharide pyruvyl transferase WcaK-like protein